ncbi:MAG: hypothetical protein LBB55_05240 [Zoogloeaceae bacterium]|nr:hypothetical protein [Zoogloeaceae bacterium]
MENIGGAPSRDAKITRFSLRRNRANPRMSAPGIQIAGKRFNLRADACFFQRDCNQGQLR